MVFNLAELPIELGLDILRIAATPALAVDRNNRMIQENIYSCARVLALVSFGVREVIMPHFLHTVILNSDRNLKRFLRTLRTQYDWNENDHRLRLDYPSIVRRIWSSQCYEPTTQVSVAYPNPNYPLLWNILSKAETIGMSFAALHLLYEVMTTTSPYLTPNNWACSRVTFAGYIPRWNEITSNPRGMQFLDQITHLTIWAPRHDYAYPHSSSGIIPNWFFRIPFQFMPELTHIAFTIVGEQDAPTTPVLVYTLPDPANGTPGEIFKSWATRLDPVSKGKVFHLNVPFKVDIRTRDFPFQWEMAYYLGEHNVWSPPANTIQRLQRRRNISEGF